MNPISWGILFFLFWLSSRILGFSGCQEVIGWFSLAMSVVYISSIFIKWWGKLLDTNRAIRLITPTVFIISVTAYILNWIGGTINLHDLNLTTDFYIGFILGYAWLVAYLLIVFNNAREVRLHRIVGIIISSLFLGLGIFYIIMSFKFQGIVFDEHMVKGLALVILGCLTMLIITGVIKLWRQFPLL